MEGEGAEPEADDPVDPLADKNADAVRKLRGFDRGDLDFLPDF